MFTGQIWFCAANGHISTAKKLSLHILKMPIPVAVRSKALMCGRLLAGTAGSNSVEGMDVCLL